MPEIVSGQSTGTTTVTPSGIEIYYQSEPKRLYRVNGVEVPSVSTVLKVLNSPLQWWGMRTGIEGCVELCNRGILTLKGPVENTQLAAQIEQKLIEQKLTVNHKSDSAKDRGQAVHDALEDWAATGLIPSPLMFPPEQQGYVEALASCLREIPSAEPVATEVMVGSAEHGFAGRYDIRIRTTKPHQVVKHYTPKRGNQYATLAPGTYLFDLKTGKDVYPNKHFPQLEGYEGASIESGYEPTDGRGVIHAAADGKYKLVRSSSNYQHFLNVLEVWKSEQAAKKK